MTADTWQGRPYRPAAQPTMISDALRAACAGMPCTPRIANFIPGHRCAHQDTVVGAHTAKFLNGMAKKPTDFGVAASCLHCHMLIDMVDKRWEWLRDNHAAAVTKRLLEGIMETQTMLWQVGIISIKGANSYTV